MSVDAAVIAAMEEAVGRDPGNGALALHLGELLLHAERPREALEAARGVLLRDPADAGALDLAARAAEAGGEREVAAGYRRLAGAMAPAGAAPASAPVAAQPAEAPAPAPPPAPAPAELEGPAEVVPLRAIEGGRGGEDGGGLERPTVTLADVGGLEEVKRKLNTAFLAPMRNPQMRAAYGKSLRGGLMLYGPPGCGKTFLARAVAGELEARFMSVGISDVLDMYIGESERKLHEIFETARRAAPCVLFLDEIDALGQKRSHLRNSGIRGTVNQLLTELDSVGASNEGVFVLSATNHPWDVDTALRRPGRFDRMMLVLPPDAPAREAILRLHLRDRPVEEGVGLGPLVGATDLFSGADLAYLCEVATEAAMERGMASGAVDPITAKDLRRAAKEIQPSTRAWFDVAYNYAMFANEGGMYDDLLGYIRARGLK